MSFKRPKTITFLAWLAFLQGAMSLFSLAILWIPGSILAESLEFVGTSVPFFVVSVLFAVTLSISAGVGLLRGTVWGWYLGATNLVLGLYRVVSSLILTFTYSALLDSPQSLVLKAVLRAAVGCVFIYWMFKDDTLAHFRLLHITKWKTLAVLLGIGLAVTVLTSIINALLV